MKIKTSTPRIIKPNIKNICKLISPNYEPFFVKKVKFDRGKINKCTFNVKDYLTEFNGTMVLGWEIAVWKDVIAEFFGHAIIKNGNKWLCVTPTKYNNEKILFIEDPKLKFSFNEENERMPVIMKALNSAKMVTRFIEIEEEIRTLKLKYPVGGGQLYLRGEEAVILKSLNEEQDNLAVRMYNAFSK